MMLMMTFTLLIAMVAPSTADARRGGGGFKSGTKSYQSTPKKADNNNINKSDSGTKSGATAGATNKPGGFFGGGGGFLKGMMLGGLAGMLFGGLFGNMGALGSLLGLAVNVLAIYVLIMVGMSIYRGIKNRRKMNDSQGGRH